MRLLFWSARCKCSNINAFCCVSRRAFKIDVSCLCLIQSGMINQS
ncbi:hypothetical protein HMPREF0091_10238 [Fannyhessea vaginae DSM 15829]|uniref:Uncharacterized protein n=1 Tax=Fannyhessea vaginae DSM 15829 TaxID=525256 RepID=F1T3J7_9ACTN|nr:hypothetical protein HMPREF0091_10238 [Fannyhessea vaginae DSM 15829]